MIGIKCKEINKANEVKNVSQCKKKLKCFMVNTIRLSSISKRDELELYIKQNKLDIVAITETWATENIWEAELHRDGYVTYRRDRREIRKARGGGGHNILQMGYLLALTNS